MEWFVFTPDRGTEKSVSKLFEHKVWNFPASVSPRRK
jgi:hypothetical protein